MIHKSDKRGPLKGALVYAPSLEGRKRSHVRNLKRDLGKGRDLEVPLCAAWMGLMVAPFLALITGALGYSTLGVVGGWVGALLPLILFYGFCAAWAWEVRKNAPSVPIYRSDDPRWVALRQALRNIDIYGGKSAWDRYEEELSRDKETPFTKELDSLTTAFLDDMEEYPDMLAELESASNDVSADSWLELQQKLEDSAKVCAMIIADAIDTHDRPILEVQANQAKQAEVTQREETRILCGNASMLASEQFFKPPQGHATHV